MFSNTGRIPLCKDCLKKQSLNDDGTLNYEKFDDVLRRTDRPYKKGAMEGALKYVRNISVKAPDRDSKLIGRYWTALQSLPQYRYLTYADSEPMTDVIECTPKESFPSINSSSSKKTSKNTIITTAYSKKWRGTYTQEDLDYLEEYYAGLERDYKIVTENHRDYARKIAKASLMMDRAYEEVLDGVPKAEEKYDKFKTIFDSLCKSAKFSEDKRSINDVGISSFSVITARVAEHNWIPEHHPLEKDDIDQLLDYLSTITKSL